MKIQLPAEVKNFATQRVLPEFTGDTCKSCSAGCCKGPGFAIFENTLMIYEKYAKGGLVREGFEFEPKLTYKQFIHKYFDIVTFGPLITFFPKILLENGNILSTPPYGQYYANRDFIRDNNVWMNNCGCIFNNKKIDQTGEFIHCILHCGNEQDEITTKPIDCMFLTCTGQGRVIKPSSQESNLWFALLEYYFPNSIQNFNNTDSVGW